VQALCGPNLSWDDDVWRQECALLMWTYRILCGVVAVDVSGCGGGITILIPAEAWGDFGGKGGIV